MKQRFPAAPDAKTPPLDAAASPQRGVVGKDAAETGDSFSYAGHATLHVVPAGRSSFHPAPQPQEPGCYEVQDEPDS